MSWRLEGRDLKGEWSLSKEERSWVERLASQGECMSSPEALEAVLAQGAELWRNEKTSILAEPNVVLPYLSPRLGIVSSKVPHHHALVDIGTDHGFLPIAVIRAELSPVALGIDIARKPLETALRHCHQAGVIGQLALALGAGADPLAHQASTYFAPWDPLHLKKWLDAVEDQKVVVSICGVGGRTAQLIIQSLPAWVTTVIVQANDQPSLVTRSLSERNQEEAVITTDLVIERRRLFVTYTLSHSHLMKPVQAPKALGLLWKWVQTSRALRRLTLTPVGHHSLTVKQTTALTALKLWELT